MKFYYSALSQNGQRKKGEIEADSIEAAKERIRKKGLFLISLDEKNEKKARASLSALFGSRRRLPLLVSRQLSSLLKGGIPLYQSLLIIESQIKNEKERQILHNISDKVRGGMSLSDALKDYPEIFDNFFVYSVKAGERSGSLGSILGYQANLLERDMQLKNRIKGALIYPLIVVCVGISVLVFLLSVVVPMMMRIFERMNQTLPFPTRLLVTSSEFLKDNLFYILIILLAFILLMPRLKKNPLLQRLTSFLLFRTPLLGELYEMTIITRFARILGTLLKSGVPMLQALLVVSGALKNPVFGERVRKMAEIVEGGGDLSFAIKQTQLLPDYIGDIVSIGEKSGTLDEMLENISENYEASISQKVSTITSVVEPFVILIVGGFVAFVLISTLLPLFEMNKLLLRR